MKIDRRRALAAAGALLSTVAFPGALRAQGKPIRIGSTEPSPRLVTKGLRLRCQCTTVGPRLLHTVRRPV